MLSDRATIFVRAGRGGDGSMSFRREAHVPRGGPDGGDGGRGGDVVLRCEDSLRDLQSFRRRGHFRAGQGGHGQGALRHGADGATLEVPVPPGTTIVSDDGSRHDLLDRGARALVARGGPGGRGNKRFAGPTRQAPRFAERGLDGEERRLELCLRLLADIGLVGVPNAGKSSLLARMTRARPRIAHYPFTTLEPVLGTIELDGRQLVLADIPGLIAGASSGAGLGHEFLAHVERCRLLVEVLDLVPLDGSDPAANHQTIEAELAAHDPRLAALPRLLVLAKADLMPAADAEQAAQEWRERLGSTPVLVTSSATGAGIEALTRRLFEMVAAGDGLRRGLTAPGRRTRGRAEALPEYRLFEPAADRRLTVRRAGDGRWTVSGRGVERLVARYDPDNEEAMAYLERRLTGAGVIGALEAKGFRPGEEVEIAGQVFELDPQAPG